LGETGRKRQLRKNKGREKGTSGVVMAAAAVTATIRAMQEKRYTKWRTAMIAKGYQSLLPCADGNRNAETE
jgi:hypothetical protein